MRPFVFLLGLLILMFTVFAFEASALSSENVVASAIENAEGVMVCAYQAVLEYHNRFVGIWLNVTGS